ncbi:hypothetical protein [Rhodopirellula sp. MGV]|uniref:hypothetical protein n=1 Tax=Rhodopirellula sp. MGV TaxID=2023130 RepID=UPI000B9641E4|nr:hypothetical protein [Rhodopirellula sp. MGV]OYP37290.1 hypothetical protein CGZ80_05590 [Rhodopirellula sp. MGV]PNY38034.1 hypothetical protein C2E31_04555 [Rhodopirellula baltica]
MINRDLNQRKSRRSRRKRRSAKAIAALLLIGLIPKNVMAEPIGFMEKFALSADRESVLSELIPGSDDFYFFYCLHYQNTQQLDRAEAALKAWSNARKGAMSPLMQAMTERQRLLTYDRNPGESIDYLIRRLNIQLNHSAPARKGERRYPSQIADELLSPQQIVKRSLHDNVALSPLGMQIAADWFLGGQPGDLGLDLNALLKRVNGPYLKSLDRLVIQELNQRNERDRRFGDLPAHQFLTLEELDEVARRVPTVADDNEFVDAKLYRLRPNADIDLSQQPEERLKYLRRVEQYTQTLSAAYSSLKASSAYRLLEANLKAGIWDKELFLRYLQLPRQSSIISPMIARLPNRANLNQDFSSVAFLPPIGSDEALIETYLEHFLLDATGIDEYTRYLQPDFVRRVFARTKLMSGVTNEQPYFEMLSAGERKELRDKVELTFAPQNPTRFASEDTTELLVDVKNIDKLVVRVYEINSLAYYRTHQETLDTDVDLDGLIPTHEQTIEYDRPTIVRHRETIRIDETKGRGVWIVDLVGKGRRARTIIRHGDLNTVRSQTANGVQITVLDENRNVINDAKLFVNNQEFAAKENGKISIPMVSQIADGQAIVYDGKIARTFRLEHLVENYELQAGFLVDPALIQSGGQTTLVVRPRLSLGSQPVDPGILSKASLRVTATDLDGIETTKTFEKIELNQAQEYAIDFRVPSRLAKLSFHLSGKVTGLSDRRERELAADHTVQLAGIRQSNQTVDAFLTRDGDDYVIETRGRNGELIGGTTVTVKFLTDLGQYRPEVTLQSDDQGRVNLGPMAPVQQLSYSVNGATWHQFDAQINKHVWPSAVHLATTDELRLPLADGSTAENYRLLEVRDGVVQQDLSAKLSVAAGQLLANDLPPGDYTLIQRETGDATSVAVVEGEKVGDVIAGEVRHRQQSQQVPLAIESIRRQDDGSVAIQLAGNTDLARVHLIASRYFGPKLPLNSLHLGLPRLNGRQLSLSRSGYVSDLRLGDEYEYVLRRQFAEKYAGVMLPQPSVLLNPWETETTSNQSQQVMAGDAPAPSAMAEPARDAAMGAAKAASFVQSETGSDFDFLRDAGVLAANLIPDENGSLVVPADVVAGMPIVQVIVSDPLTVMQQTVTGPLKEAEIDDLRLASSLPAEKALSFERVVSVVTPDQPLDLETLGSAQLQVFGDIASLLSLYRTLVSDDRFADFDVLARWHAMDDEQKLTEYSKLACHELHLFLYMHDGEFFNSVIRPYLANKNEKQFIDHWLLGDDLTSYGELWRYQHLSAAERALLAMRLPEMRSSIIRDLNETVDAMKDDFDRRRMLVETALQSRGLSVAFDREEMAAESDFAVPQSLGYAMGGMGGGIDGLSQNQVKESLQRSRAVQLFRKQPANTPMLGRRMSGMLSERELGDTRYMYQQLDSTKQWAENQFDHVRTVGSNPLDLIPINAFWRDLAGQDISEGNAPAMSNHLLAPTTSRHSALLALAMSGLPLQAGEIGLPTKPETMYRPEHSVALIAKRLRELQTSDENASVLIGQLFRLSNPNPNEDEEKAVTEKFLTGRAYKGQVVVSNPTAEQKTLEVFWQIPAGSLPLAGSQMTDSKTFVVNAFGVASVEYEFYFPAAGEFVHYPANVSAGDELLASADQMKFRVADEWSDDEVTWQRIAVDGSADQIRDYLAKANLHKLDWSLVYHRLRDKAVYGVVTDALKTAKVPQTDVWAYGFYHKDESAMRRYLSLRNDLIQSVGPELDSTLLTVDAIDRQSYEHLEYAPLVRARIHRLGDQDEILNSKFLGQYQQFVRGLGFQPSIDVEQKLPLSYYLLLQNRIEESIAVFGELDRDTVETQLQYDYMAGYLAMHRGDYETALQIANAHANHPVPRWKTRFGQMALQVLQRSDLMDSGQLVSVDSSESGDASVSPQAADLAIADRDRANSQASAEVPEASIKVEGDQIRIDHRNTDQVELNFYGVDLELLFSKAPFARNDLQKIAMVRPTQSETVQLNGSSGTTRLEIPRQLRSRTLLVESHVGASRSTTLYYGGELTTYVSDAFGQLQTTDATTHRPIAGAYVKVYARYPGGDVRFFKDGYTDGRGRFDYTSISAADAKGAERYAILVLSETKGATLHDVAAP